MDLYLVRHGETEYNRRRIVQGRKIDAPLNATGLRQAARLADRFAGIRLDAVYASTLRRAIQTADEVARRHPGVKQFRLASIAEMHWGQYEGRPFDEEVVAVYTRLRARWERGEYEERIPGGESILEVARRGREALEHLVERHVGQTVLAVTHGRFLRVLLASLLPEYGLARMEQIPHANTGVNLLRYNDGRFSLALLNCTQHLEEAVKDPDR